MLKSFKVCNTCLKDGIDKGDNITEGMPGGYCDICNDRKPRSLNNINLDVEVNATVGNLAFWLVQETLSDY